MSPSLVLQTGVRARIDGAKIAFVSRAEPQAVVFGVIREAGVHPVDADPRLLEILFSAGLIEVRCDARKFSRNSLFSPLGEGFRPPIENLGDGETIVFVGWGLICWDGRLLCRCGGGGPLFAVTDLCFAAPDDRCFAASDGVANTHIEPKVARQHSAAAIRDVPSIVVSSGRMLFQPILADDSLFRGGGGRCFRDPIVGRPGFPSNGQPIT